MKAYLFMEILVFNISPSREAMLLVINMTSCIANTTTWRWAKVYR